jgi:zinc transporter ZupT
VWPLLASLASALVSAIGIAAARWKHDRAVRGSDVILGVASGVLVTAALTHLLPEALAGTARAPLWAVLGFAALLFLERGGAEDACEPREAIGWAPLIGISLHSFLDGLTYTAAFSAGNVSGATVAAGMVLHEVPEGVIVYTLLARHGLAPRPAAIWAWLAAGLTTPLGVICALPLLAVLDASTRSALVAAVGGALLYVGAAHLWPRVERSGSRWGVVAFAIGAGLALSSGLLGQG